MLSCPGKLFPSILNQKLLQYELENNILREEQLGFRAGNRTSDAHYTTQPITTELPQKRTNIFSCFIDFRKAFDSIPRDNLFTKRLEIGISGKFFNILKTL